MDELDDAQLVSPDPGERARRAGELIDEHQAAIGELSRLRREALNELVSLGQTHAEIAKTLGMTRSRIGQLLSSGPRPERAFLGVGKLMVVLGAKLEAGKEQPGPVVSDGAFAAYERLAQLARTLGLDAEYEIAPPPGMIQLNRTNLIVVCGPRLSPLVAQVLESDPNLGFAKDESGWFIVEKSTGEQFRSPMDSGENQDLAYVGRLPRPDRKGSFLYIAGVHARGAIGAVEYVEANLEELYREVKTRGFSLIVGTRFGDNNSVESAWRVGPIHRHEVT
jgi:hypothetical protein